MKELYFINLVGNLNTAAWVLFSVICLAIFAIGLAYYMEDIEAVNTKRLLKPMTIVAVVCLVLGIVVPTKKDL